MGWLHSKLCVLAAGMADDRLKYLAFIKRTNNGGDRVHQLEVLFLHIVGEQAS